MRNTLIPTLISFLLITLVGAEPAHAQCDIEAEIGRAAARIEKAREVVEKSGLPEARELLHAAATRAMSLYPVIPLYFRASRNLIGGHVTGWVDNVRDLHPSRYLSLDGEPAKKEQEPEQTPEKEPEQAPEQE